MRAIFCVLIVMLMSNRAVAQVQNDSTKVLYVGYDNPLTIAVEGYPSSALVVTTDNGTISGSDGRYTAYPISSTPATLHVAVKTQKGFKEIKTMTLRTQCMPHETGIGRRNSGYVPTATIHTLLALDGSIKGFDFEPRFVISGCTVIVVRNEVEIFRKHIFKEKGCSFSMDNEIEDMMQSVKAGDKLKFNDITSYGPGECTGNVPSFEVTAN